MRKEDIFHFCTVRDFSHFCCLNCTRDIAHNLHAPQRSAPQNSVSFAWNLLHRSSVTHLAISYSYLTFQVKCHSHSVVFPDPRLPSAPQHTPIALWSSSFLTPSIGKHSVNARKVQEGTDGFWTLTHSRSSTDVFRINKNKSHVKELVI